MALIYRTTILCPTKDGGRNRLMSKSYYTEKDIENILSKGSEKGFPELSQEFKTHEMERILQRKKEKEAEIEAQYNENSNQYQNIVNLKETTNHLEINNSEPESSKHSQTKIIRLRAFTSIAAAFVFLFFGTILTRDSLRNSIPVTPTNGQITVVEGSDGTPSSNYDVIDTADIEGKNEIVSFFEDMWLFAKKSFPFW